MNARRGRDDDFYWGSELDELDEELDDDGDALSDEEENSGDEGVHAVEGMVEDEPEEVEGSSDEEADAAAALADLSSEWQMLEVTAEDAVDANVAQPKSSFLAAQPLGFNGKTTPSDFVFEFLSRDFFLSIWQRSLEHQMNDNQFPRDKRAKKIELHEIYQYFGILDVLSVRCPTGAKVDCWSANPFLECKPIKEVMSFRRFSLIKRHLKMAYCSNLTEDNRLVRDAQDRLWRVRLLLEEMGRRNHGKFDTNGIKTLDEQVIQAHQRRIPFGLKQQFPNKPIGTGIRVESLNDRSGFTMSTLLTQDTKLFEEIMYGYPKARENLSVSRQKYFACIMQGVGSKTFQRGEYMVIVMDNLFVDLSLAEELFKYGICIVGTWRVNFGVPKALKDAKVSTAKPYVAMQRTFKVQRGRSWVEGQMLGVKILGHGSKKKGFYMLSTCPDIGVKALLARAPFGDGQPRTILEINHVYNLGKIGTDVEDQLRASYPIEMRPRRWPLAVLYWGYREQTVQGYICMRKMFPLKKITHKDFLLQHAEFLLKGGPDAPQALLMSPRSPLAGQASPQMSSEPLTPRVTKRLRQEIATSPPSAHVFGQSQLRRCYLCAANHIRRRTTWCCTSCQFVPVCKDCFSEHMGLQQV